MIQVWYYRHIIIQGFQSLLNSTGTGIHTPEQHHDKRQTQYFHVFVIIIDMYIHEDKCWKEIDRKPELGEW